MAVGDDAQPIGRFRGACASNLLEFPRRFPGSRVVELSPNYRFHRDIVAAGGEWMDAAAQWDVAGQSFRYAKDILADDHGGHPDYPAVIAVPGTDPRDESRWLAGLMRFLRSGGVIAG